MNSLWTAVVQMLMASELKQSRSKNNHHQSFGFNWAVSVEKEQENGEYGASITVSAGVLLARWLLFFLYFFFAQKRKRRSHAVWFCIISLGFYPILETRKTKKGASWVHRNQINFGWIRSVSIRPMRGPDLLLCNNIATLFFDRLFSLLLHSPRMRVLKPRKVNDRMRTSG